MNRTIHILLVLLLSTLTFQASAADEEAPPGAVYFEIKEPFTVNFLTQSEDQYRYFQMKVSLMAHDADVIANAELNLPMVQDALRTLFTEQPYEVVSSVKGRKALQKKALKTVKKILKEETGNDDLDAVYFTSIILQ